MSEDWTTGPAKWAAVLVLGSASIFGIAWSVLTRGPHAGEPATSSIVQIAPPAEPASSGEPQPEHSDPAPAATPAVVKRININTATAAELELLPGVGPALAGRIVDYRR